VVATSYHALTSVTTKCNINLAKISVRAFPVHPPVALGCDLPDGLGFLGICHASWRPVTGKVTLCGIPGMGSAVGRIPLLRSLAESVGNPDPAEVRTDRGATRLAAGLACAAIPSPNCSTKRPAHNVTGARYAIRTHCVLNSLACQAPAFRTSSTRAHCFGFAGRKLVEDGRRRHRVEPG